jgi:hypothetical protein
MNAQVAGNIRADTVPTMAQTLETRIKLGRVYIRLVLSVYAVAR